MAEAEDFCESILLPELLEDIRTEMPVARRILQITLKRCTLFIVKAGRWAELSLLSILSELHKAQRGINNNLKILKNALKHIKH